jgi:N-acetylglucosamine malate deacetylase 1
MPKFIKRIVMMENLSETEFALQTGNDSFLPKYFIEISDLMRKKIENRKIYQSELGNHPFSRSINATKILPHFKKGEGLAVSF